MIMENGRSTAGEGVEPARKGAAESPIWKTKQQLSRKKTPIREMGAFQQEPIKVDSPV
jgi:hypothetical protein